MDWVCKHCKISFNFERWNDKANHTRWCDSNPRRPEFVESRKNVSKDTRAKLSKASSSRIISDETRAKLSTSSRGRKHSAEAIKKIKIAALNSSHRRLQRNIIQYTMTNGKQIILDSSWELKLAERLDSLKIRWTRPEPLIWIDTTGTKRHYFPDFYLNDFDVYLDPKNLFVQNVQSEKLTYILEHYNVLILSSLEQCEKFDIGYLAQLDEQRPSKP